MTISRIYELAMLQATNTWSHEQDIATKTGSEIDQERANRLWEELHQIETLYQELPEEAFQPIVQ